MLYTIVLALPGRTATHAWRTAHNSSGTVEGGHAPPFGSKHTQWGSCLDSESASPWPSHPVVPESSCVMCSVGRGIVPDTHKIYTKFHPKTPVARKAYYCGKAWCSVGGSGFHPAPTVHSSLHGGWYPIPWLRGHGCHLWFGCTHLSMSPLACGAHEHDQNCETAWSKTHHWRHSASSAWGPTFCPLFPAPSSVTCDPKSIWDIWSDA